jgi:hypothetical protein
MENVFESSSDRSCTLVFGSAQIIQPFVDIYNRYDPIGQCAGYSQRSEQSLTLLTFHCSVLSVVYVSTCISRRLFFGFVSSTRCTPARPRTTNGGGFTCGSMLCGGYERGEEFEKAAAVCAQWTRRVASIDYRQARHHYVGQLQVVAD